jgi:multimeric flavodoxin WrbA
MRIVALQGSPRAEGNTQTVLDMVLEGARQAGAQTETVKLVELEDFRGCMECFGCQGTADKPDCQVEDDMLVVLGKLMKADVIVWATPVFCWSPAWPLKMAMDRFFCMFKFQEDGEIRSLVEGRRMAAVVTAGGTESDGADLVQEICRRLVEFSRCKWEGTFVAAEVKDVESIRKDAALAKRARAFGKKLAS